MLYYIMETSMTNPAGIIRLTWNDTGKISVAPAQ